MLHLACNNKLLKDDGVPFDNPELYISRVGDPNDIRSTTGLVVFLGYNPISWSSKKQNTVSRSSTEAKYRAIASIAPEIEGLFFTTPSTMLHDYLLAIALTCNLVMHQRTKHIEIDVHFVHERVAKQLIQMQFVFQ